jgi:hypothetical protein
MWELFLITVGADSISCVHIHTCLARSSQVLSCFKLVSGVTTDLLPSSQGLISMEPQHCVEAFLPGTTQ